MDIHEYQAKELLAGFGVAIPRGGVAYSPEQAVYRASEIGGARWAVKAQIHSGARGKAGGIKLCTNEDEVRQAAKALLGKRLVTHQTGPEGRVVHRLYVEAAVPIEREIYLGFVLDRKSERIMIVASAQGGMEIEEIAERSPDTIIRAVVEPAVGMTAFQAREIAFALGLDAGPGDPRGDHPARLLPRVPRPRRHDGGDQPARGHDGRPAPGARLQDDVRRQRAVPAAERERAARLRRGRSAGVAGAPSTGSTTSRSTATSAASSTARASRWPRWT